MCDSSPAYAAVIAGRVLGVLGGKNCTAQLETFGDSGVETSAQVLPALNTPPLALVNVTVPPGFVEPDTAASPTVAVHVSDAVAITRLQITWAVVGCRTTQVPLASRNWPVGQAG